MSPMTKDEGADSGTAGSSRSDCPKGFYYDMFLSFRGPDTRDGFADRLHESLTNSGFRVFMDDEEIRQGEEIGWKILRAIEDSKIYIPIFFTGYASSRWCLRELAHMVECAYPDSSGGRTGHEILPIFYDVEPSDLKLETKLYGDALRRHEEEQGRHVVKPWEEALRKVAKIKGWQIKGQRHSVVIGDIKQEISRGMTTRERNVPDDLVGITDRVEYIKKLLDPTCDDIRVVVIYGMGGIGKTTLANVVCNELSPLFQGWSFLRDVRESSSRFDGIEKLQKKLLWDLFNLTRPETFDIDEGVNMIKHRLPNKRVLIVLDDVDDGDQLMQLAAKPDWFCPRSRIIITTRDTRVIPTTKVEGLEESVLMQPIKIYPYEMMGLHSDHALQLFSKRAFGTDSPPPDFYYLSREVVALIGGLPLTVGVIGSYLRTIKNEPWDGALKKLKEVPQKEVLEKLIISYDALEDDTKQIFLDIACFFVMKRKTNAFYMWESCNLFPNAEFQVLIRKSLIKIVDGDRIWMHDQLRDLGREIVRQENIINPEGRSRLWSRKMALDIVRARKGTDNVVALALLGSRHNFTREDFADLSKIRFLEMDGGNFTGDFENIFSELRWLCWRHCPSKLQANNFLLKSLVNLKLSGNIIIDKWSGWVQIMMGSQLKVLNLKGSKFLTRTPDFIGCLNLERLIIRDCENLNEIDGSIRKLEQLECLKIKWCPRLKDLPKEIGCLSSLRELILIQCQYIRNLPSWIGKLTGLSRLVMEDLGLDQLPQEISELVDLKYLSLMNSTRLKELPYAMGLLKSLVELDLSGTLIGGLPLSIVNLENVVVKINSSAIKLQLEDCGKRSTSYLSAQRSELYGKIMSGGELGSSLRLSEYPIDLLIECGMIQTEYDVDLQCMPSYIKEISASTIFNASETRCPASTSEAILFDCGIVKSPCSMGEVENLIYSLVSLLERIRAIDFCFRSHLQVCCVSPENPLLGVKIASKDRAYGLLNRRYCDLCLQVLNSLPLPSQHMQISNKLGLMPDLTLGLRMALDGSKVLSCEMKIEARWLALSNSRSESVECPYSMEKLETLVSTYSSWDHGREVYKMYGRELYKMYIWKKRKRKIA
ncbi:disease resistance protein RUN1-like [Eucalyptus grandis]|uniref:disease resistance protein RUN1-like n=1 Tax=Eucalyptus grandis TaxID=71139 RepID=UPI00192ED8E8|nr:disease resistance protein RUN1-like [Eucalyptus grandis]